MRFYECDLCTRSPLCRRCVLVHSGGILCWPCAENDVAVAPDRLGVVARWHPAFWVATAVLGYILVSAILLGLFAGSHFSAPESMWSSSGRHLRSVFVGYLQLCGVLKPSSEPFTPLPNETALASLAMAAAGVAVRRRAIQM